MRHFSNLAKQCNTNQGKLRSRTLDLFSSHNFCYRICKWSAILFNSVQAMWISLILLNVNTLFNKRLYEKKSNWTIKLL